MKDLKLFVNKDMYDKLEVLRNAGVDIDIFIQESIDGVLKEFKENPESFVKKFAEIENDYQTKYNIN